MENPKTILTWGDNIPRRSCLFLLTPSESLIRKATEEAEKLGADPRLTDAVIKLSEASNLIADFIDEHLQK